MTFCKIGIDGKIICMSKKFSLLFNTNNIKEIVSAADFEKIINITDILILDFVKINDSIYSINCCKTFDHNIFCNFIENQIVKADLFVSYTSHEIKTILNGIVGMLDLINDTPLNSKQNEYIKIINECSQQLVNIINDIFDYTKIEINGFKNNLETFNVIECIEEVFDIISLQAAQKKINIYQDQNNEILFIISDKCRIKQILINLLENAIKYTPDNGIIIIKFTLIDSFIKFSVSDNGMGIPLKDQDKVFTLFKLNNSFNLGLVVCKNIVEIMGGKISLESKPNKGSIFTFTIPIEVSNDENLPFQDYSLKDKIILVVDDKELNRNILFNNITKWYSKPILCSSAKETINYINKFTIDIAIIDIEMPVINGVELAKIIKKKWKTIPLIAIPSINDKIPDDNPFDSIVSKPIKSLRLYNTIIKLIGFKFNSKYTPENIVKYTRILLIIDSNYTHNLFISYLKKLNYVNIFRASSCIEGLNNIKQNTFDLVFLDTKLSGINTFNCIKSILQITKNLLIIAITDDNSKKAEERCIKNGFNAVIVKPINFNDFNLLMEIVEKKIKK